MGAVLIITGGIVPIEKDQLSGAAMMMTDEDVKSYDFYKVAHDEGGKIVAQILHAGRWYL